MSIDFEALAAAFNRVPKSDLESLISSISPDDAARAESDSRNLSKVLRKSAEEHFSYQMDTTEAVGSALWEGFWVMFEIYAPAFFYKTSILSLLGEVEKQKGLARITPTKLDVSVVQRLVNMYPKDAKAVSDDLKYHGYTDDRIDKLIKAGKQTLAEDDIKSLYLLKIISRDETVSHLKRAGFESQSITSLVSSWETPLGYGELGSLLLRGHISEGNFQTGVESLGVSSKNTNLLRKLVDERPGVSDLVRMAVREVFTPATASKYGLFEDYPPEFEAEAQKSGLAPEWSKRFWGAHWELPSLQMGFEMYHRKVINQDDIRELMRAQDVMPYWRDKLEAISYNVVTRVDIRRMYDLGVIDRTRVKRSYTDSGYNDDDAELLTQFTEAHYGEDDRALSKTEILAAYEAGLIARDDTVAYLDAFGYTTEDAQMVVDIYDHKRSVKLLKKSVSSITKQYANDYISESEATAKFAGLGLDNSAIQIQIDAGNVTRSSRVAPLNLETLSKAFAKNIITVADFRARLSNKGYNKADIEILIELNKG